MANIIQNWRRFTATSCLHSTHACTVALDNAMAFVEDYEPHDRIDLGDLHDFAALRTGAAGTNDESESLIEDFDAGISWLRRYRPNKRCLGNHDHRMYKAQYDRRAALSHYSRMVVNAIAEVDRENEAEVLPYFPMRKNWFILGGTYFGHGFMFNENAVRDHAEMVGAPVVIGHLHVPQMVAGRTFKSTPSYCVGTLSDPDHHDYAMTRRNTLRWAHGLVYGEYSDKTCHVNLLTAECQHGAPEDWGVMA